MEEDIKIPDMCPCLISQTTVNGLSKLSIKIQRFTVVV